jgi:hypothetical protein
MENTSGILRPNTATEKKTFSAWEKGAQPNAPSNNIAQAIGV